MRVERYFLEIYIPGKVLPDLKTRVSSDCQNEDHLHITLVRPFSIKENSNEEELKNTIIDFYRDKKEIKYVLEGKDSFDEKYFYIPVVSEELNKLDSDIEKKLEDLVEFDVKLNDEKIHHLSVDKNINPYPKTNMIAKELICIRNKKDGSGKRIWFGFDLIDKKILSREEILERK